MCKLIRMIIELASRLNSNLLIKNVLKTNHKKKVLVSYITSPFKNKTTTLSHTNIREVQVIADVMDELDFDIDLIDFNIKLELDFSKYDLIFGFGETFENSFYDSHFNGKRIYYATGAYVNFQNSAEINRVLEFNRVKYVKLLPKRIVPWTWSISTAMSDALIIIGNTWTESTYKPYCNNPVYRINATGSFIKGLDFPNRNINDSRKSFLWFGSTGLIHKGLDVCLDFFSKHTYLQLHICGPNEVDFFSIYEKELLLENIHYHGFVDIESEIFQQISNQCLFTIMPSCSEGQSTALLTSMCTGLIPIATKQTGIDIDIYGFLLEDISTNAIFKIVSKIGKICDDELLKMSSFTFNDIRQKHTLESFKESFRELINKIISQ